MLLFVFCFILLQLCRSEPESQPRKLEVGGASLTLSEVPVIVNKDGSLRRIQNWESMYPREKEAASRRIKERNAIRLAALREQPPELLGRSEIDLRETNVEGKVRDEEPVEVLSLPLKSELVS